MKSGHPGLLEVLGDLEWSLAVLWSDNVARHDRYERNQMNSIPLQYESLKAVLLYMDANIRFKISQRLPTIRITEKVVPLKVRSLKFDEYRTTVNDTTYQLGIYREYNSGETIAREIQWYNEYGGVPHDLDRHGFQISPGNTVLTPGDVSFGGYNRREFRHDTIQNERLYREMLKGYEKALFLKTNSEITESDPIGQYVRRGLEMPLDTLKYRIDNLYTALLPFECRRFNLKPPYVCYIQLTVQTGNKKQIERFPCKMKLYEAMKLLNNCLFGDRSSSILAEKFRLPRESIILRLPVQFKVKTRNLENVFGLTFLNDAVISMLDPSSLSLDSVDIFIIDGRDFQLPIVSCAKKLIISYIGPAEDFSDILRGCPNQQVYLPYNCRWYRVEQLLNIVLSWFEKPVGSCFSQEVTKEKTVKDLFKLIKTRVEKTKRTKRCISTITKDSTRLEVFYVPIKNSGGQKTVNSKWVLKIRIVRL
ncbi:hypothetical protein GCK72_007403 [Caenorhabditis remanei]|uniref:Uncharacterized protein n=1 Tax=Caenorhabditis remanei TaxID=31234 RepID=A0A6A5HLF4_CAERE|nr:hypothetical protein GCK72_007403 [Caenorhabditis remanei]KAF1767444.1 hypothetical protein GCK72_007403 [Caenorhabditis remanei]